MNPLILRLSSAAPVLGLVAGAFAAVGAGGCDVLAEAEDPPPPPPPSWIQTRPFPEIRELTDVVMLPSGVAFAVGSDGVVLRIDGNRFIREESGTTEDLQGISAVLDEEQEPLLLACGANGAAILRRGGTWSVLDTGADTFLFSAWLRSPTDGFVVGDSGTIYRFNGTGLVLMDVQSEQPVEITDANGNPAIDYFPIPEALKGVAGSGGAVWAVGAGGAVFRFDAGADPNDLGNRWVREDSTTQRPLVSLFSRAGLWAPTIDGVVVRSGGDGAWNDDFTGPVPVFLQDVFVTDGHEVLVGLVDRLYHRHVKDAGEETERRAWDAVELDQGAFLRAVDGVYLPLPDDAEEGDQPELLVVAVGGGGRIVRGPTRPRTPDDEPLLAAEIEPVQ